MSSVRRSFPLLRDALQESSIQEMRGPSWNALRELLGSISRSRAIQGFTPAETATFSLSLKRPLFERIRSAAEGDIDVTKMVTAASEIARNTLDYGGGGAVRLEALTDGLRRGLRLVFEDEGPGIADVEQALKDGYTTGGGLGLGLGGTRRLVSEFEIESSPGKGTRVTPVRWK